MNKEQYPKWNLMMLLLAAWFVIAIVVGSIWIMDNLNYNMSPDDVDKQLIEDEGYKP
jgi:heme/copper-type cytochrome/quinol oxidase subunit 4